MVTLAVTQVGKKGKSYFCQFQGVNRDWLVVERDGDEVFRCEVTRAKCKHSALRHCVQMRVVVGVYRVCANAICGGRI